MQAPANLYGVQRWFGGVIATPLNEEGKSDPIDADALICPSPTLTPHERMEIYNQQYWYRLLTVMQENFPLLVHFLGYREFNKLVTPYLTENPPHTWQLNKLGHKLAEWLDDPLFKASAAVDWAWEQAFIERALPPLTGEPAEILESPLQLQPHLTLLELPCDLLPIREANEGEPLWEGPYPVAIFRGPTSQVHWERLHPEELPLLRSIAGGQTLLAALEGLPEAHAEELPFWLQNWVIRGWLTASPADPP